jgi:hypothetical protein
MNKIYKKYIIWGVLFPFLPLQGKFFAGPIFSAYKLKDSTVFDVGGNKDKLANSSLKLVPGFLIGWEGRTSLDSCNKELLLVGGLKFGYNGRKKAVIADYKEPDAAIEFNVKQNVTDLYFTPYIGLETNRFEKMTLGATVGCSLARKTLDKLQVFYKINDAYCGLSLKPEPISFFGEFGIYASRKCNNDKYVMKLGYSFSVGHVKYGSRVFIETPDAGAPVQFQSITLLTDSNNIYLLYQPTFGLHKHAISLSLSMAL